MTLAARPASSPTLEQLPPPPPGRTGWPWTEASPPLPPLLAKGRAWPRISIITASYNQGRYIEETLRSVLLQGYPNLEFMILDGGSSDDSLRIIEKYEPWLSSVVVDASTGYTTRLHMGLERSTGSLQAWLNTDDTYEPGTLARVARFFAAHPDTAMANGDVYFIDQDSKRKKRHFAMAMNRTITGNLGWHRCPQPGCFWPKWAYEQAGGIDTTFRFAMDRELYLRLSMVGRCRRLPGPPVASFRQHPEARSSTQLELWARENVILINKYGNPWFRARYGRLRLMWFAWSLQRRFREHATRFGLEY